MDFVHDQLFGGRAFRVLTIVDQFSRQTPLLESRFSFGGRDVVAALGRAIERAGTPVSITARSSRRKCSRNGRIGEA
jgi:putative transposase